VGVDCAKCITSACCAYVVEVSENEYNKLKALGYGSDFETYTDRFIKSHPGHENKRPIIDDLHREKYAVLKKGKDGLCVTIDRKYVENTRRQGAGKLEY